MINGYGVNGAYNPAWVVRAAVVAVAAAATITAAPTRVVSASVSANAAVSVTVTDLHVVGASASASSGATSSSINSRTKFAGRVASNANAVGYALVVRVIPASAGGDAAATGAALPNAKLGDVSASSLSSVVLCKAHRIRPAASNTSATASVVAPASKVTRYSPVSGSAAATGRAEASKKLSGQSYFRHDGFVINAASTASALVDQTKTKITATLGAFDFANSTGGATPFIRYASSLSAPCSSFGVAVVARRLHAGAVSATALASATVTPVKVRPASLQATGDAEIVLIKVAQRHAASATDLLAFSDVSANASRKAVGLVSATAGASSLAIIPGRQFFVIAGGNAESLARPASVVTKATASGIGACSATVPPATQHYAQVLQAGMLTSFISPAGTQHRATALGSCESQGLPVESRYAKYGAQASGSATAYLVQSSFGNQVQGVTTGVAASEAAPPSANIKFRATATGLSNAFLTSSSFGAQKSASSIATGLSQGIQAVGKYAKYGAQASGSATSFLVLSSFGAQQRGAVSAIGASAATLLPGKINYRASAVGLSTAFLSSSVFGTQQRGAAVATATSTRQSVFVRLLAKASGSAQAPIGTATAGNKSDEPAPEERQMTLSGDDRAMLVASEDRIMVVPS